MEAILIIIYLFIFFFWFLVEIFEKKIFNAIANINTSKKYLNTLHHKIYASVTQYTVSLNSVKLQVKKYINGLGQGRSLSLG